MIERELWECWQRLFCVFGFHLPAEHCGEVKIRYMNGETGEIDYGNVMRCPRCKKYIRLDNSR